MDERDEVINRLSARLRVLPEVDPEAKAKLLIAVAAERERDRAQAQRRRRLMRRSPWIGGGLLVAAALMLTVVMRPRTESPGAHVASLPSAGAPTATLAAGDAATLEMAPRPIQFVFREPGAAHVDVVGDFNSWEKAPMLRDSASGLWSTTVMVRPGRHVYAFVVNDSLWKRDPRAVAAPDADFGRPGSVLLVGRPTAEGTK